MGLLSSLSKAVNTFVEDLNTPESFKKGQKFEQYARDVVFPRSKYKLLKQTHDYAQNKHDYVDESKEPDFKFQCLETGKEFYVEAKFRSSIYKGKLTVCKNAEQLARYKKIGKETPVFLLFGFGEEPDKPEAIALFPIEVLTDFMITVDFAEKYEIYEDRALYSSKLWAMSKNIPLSKAEPQQHREPAVAHKGFCIRCKQEIKPDPNKPLCPKCYTEWNKYKNQDYKEKYCHLCGKNHDSSVAKPLCLNCFKQMR